MTDPKSPTEQTTDAVPNDASKPLETEAGRENAEQVGGEHDGPIKAPDAADGAYVIP